jgi:hypothetical protein
VDRHQHRHHWHIDNPDLIGAENADVGRTLRPGQGRWTCKTEQIAQFRDP